MKILWCDECEVGFSVERAVKHRPLDTDIIDVGLECPNCQAWYHSYIDSREMANKRESLKTSQDRKEYSKNFVKFQKRMRAKYGYKRIKGKWSLRSEQSLQKE